MISHGSRRCFGCGHPGTRRAIIDGRLTWLCNDCPSPAEITVRRNAIRDAWSPAEAASRRYDCPVHLALERERAWLPPACTVSEPSGE